MKNNRVLDICPEVFCGFEFLTNSNHKEINLLSQEARSQVSQ